MNAGGAVGRMAAAAADIAVVGPTGTSMPATKPIAAPVASAAIMTLPSSVALPIGGLSTG
jgi:hypothetical protein